MKKNIISLFLLSTLSTHTMDQPIKQCEWREKFSKVNHTELTKKLGYNPNVRLIQKNDTNLVNQGGQHYMSMGG